MANRQLMLFKEPGLEAYHCSDIQVRGEKIEPFDNYQEPEVDESPEYGFVHLTEPDRVPALWGIRKKDLLILDKNTLEDIFYGTWNLYIPTEILDLENPAEIIANYLAAGVLKRSNSHKVNDAIPKRSFSELIKYMNSTAYSNPVFRRNFRGFETRFSVAPGMQKKRFESLSGDVKRRFCASFLGDYRPSDQEAPGTGAYRDPQTQSGYACSIYSYLKSRFEREHVK